MRSGPRKPHTPVGTKIGRFVVESHEYDTGAGVHERHRYVLRDMRCGHTTEIRTTRVDLSARVTGKKAVCGCPSPYISEGYVKLQWTMPDGRRVTVREHHIVMESVIHRELYDFETVHHINGDRQDNRPENLQLRSGQHGKGAVVVCHDCGSQNVGYAPIGEAA